MTSPSRPTRPRASRPRRPRRGLTAESPARGPRPGDCHLGGAPRREREGYVSKGRPGPRSVALISEASVAGWVRRAWSRSGTRSCVWYPAGSVNVVRVEQYEADTVLTLDRRNFCVIGPLTGHIAFRLLA